METRSRYNTLDQLLDDYRQNGVDSEGYFTLNPARARELLEQFQLPEPAHYALHLVSFLIGAGAKKVSVSSSHKGMRFEAPGATVETETLARPFSVLLRSEAKPHLRELALGLNSLLGQRGGTAEIHFGSSRGRYTSHTVEVEDAPPARCLTVITSPRLGGGDREPELLSGAFRRSPAPLSLNGASLRSPNFPGAEEGLQILLYNRSYPLMLAPQAFNRLSRETSAPFSALIEISRGAPAFRIVYLGREYRQFPSWGFLLPGWQVQITVNCDLLKKDLSQQAILENEVFANLSNSLRVQVEQAVDFLLGQIPPLPRSEELTDDLIEYLFRHRRVEEALAYQRNLAQALALVGDKFQKAKAMYRLTLMEATVSHGQVPDRFDHALGMLQEAADRRRPNEPDWTVLKAKLAFRTDHAALEPMVESFLHRNRVTRVMKEQCYRWLLRYGRQHPDSLAWHRLGLAREVYRAGRLEEALFLLEQSQGGGEHRSLDHDLQVAEIRADIAAQQGQFEACLEHLGRQLTLLREKYGQYSLKLGPTLERLVLLLEHAGQKQRAREYKTWSRRLYQ